MLQVKENKRYAGNEGWTVSECAAKVGGRRDPDQWLQPALVLLDEPREPAHGPASPSSAARSPMASQLAEEESLTLSMQVAKDWGKVDILVHSLANGPEVRGIGNKGGGSLGCTPLAARGARRRRLRRCGAILLCWQQPSVLRAAALHGRLLPLPTSAPARSSPARPPPPSPHSLLAARQVQKSLLETSRRGYLAAMSASSYSFVSLMQVGLVSGGLWCSGRGR